MWLLVLLVVKCSNISLKTESVHVYLCATCWLLVYFLLELFDRALY